jgi:ribosome-binding ATPase YchF (GTP1/OBG family)
MMDDDASRQEYLSLFGLQSSKLDEVTALTRQVLRQITYFTVGPSETRAISIPAGCTVLCNFQFVVDIS